MQKVWNQSVLVLTWLAVQAISWGQGPSNQLWNMHTHTSSLGSWPYSSGLVGTVTWIIVVTYSTLLQCSALDIQLLPLNVGYMTSSHCCLDWMACCIDLEYSYLRFNLSVCGLLTPKQSSNHELRLFMWNNPAFSFTSRATGTSVKHAVKLGWGSLKWWAIDNEELQFCIWLKQISSFDDFSYM